MNVQNTWDRLQQLPSLLVKLGKQDSDAVEEVQALLRLTRNEPMKRNCHSCITKAYHQLTSITYENLLKMAHQKYKLKEGNVVDFAFTHYTPETMTDDIAQQMVDSNPANADLFDPAPSPSKKADKKEDKVSKADEKAAN